MGIYKDESLRKYPWLWKYDKRFKRGCQFQGHRFHWNQLIQLSGFHASIGQCMRCTKLCRVAVTIDKKSKVVKLAKVFEDSEIVVLTPDEVQELKEFVKERTHKKSNTNGE